MVLSVCCCQRLVLPNLLPRPDYLKQNTHVMECGLLTQSFKWVWYQYCGYHWPTGFWLISFSGEIFFTQGVLLHTLGCHCSFPRGDRFIDRSLLPAVALLTAPSTHLVANPGGTSQTVHECGLIYSYLKQVSIIAH